MDAGQKMDIQVARDGRAVVPVIPPAEGPGGVERAFGGVAEEAVPVDGFLAGVERDGVLPGADGRVAIVASLDRIDGADGAVGDQLASLVVEDRAGVLAADLEDSAGLFLGGDDVVPLGHLVDHGFLAIDGLAGLHRINGHPRVPVVRHADEDGVDIVAVQDLAVVDIHIDILAVDFLGVYATAVVDVGRGDQFDPRNLERGVRVDEADDAHADGGDLEAFVRACRLRGSRSSLELEHLIGEGVRRQWGHGGGGGHGLQEGTARARSGCGHRNALPGALADRGPADPSARPATLDPL